MCGIVGFIRSGKFTTLEETSQNKWFRQALLCDQVRGTDGTGAMLINSKGEWDGYKKALPAGEALQLQGFQRLLLGKLPNASVAIGHNRASTKGGNSQDNCHPFVEDHIILVHNGTLISQGGLDIFNYSDSDSKYICKNMVRMGEKAALEGLRGSFALVWFNLQTNTLHMARNDERPLVFLHGKTAKNKSLILYGSEPGLLYWLADRNEIEVEQKYKVVSPYNEYIFPLDNPAEYSKSTFKKYTPTTVMHQAYHEFGQRIPRFNRPDLPKDIHNEAVVEFYPTKFAPYTGKGQDVVRGTVIGYVQSRTKNNEQFLAHMYGISEENYDTMPDGVAVKIMYVPHENSSDPSFTVKLTNETIVIPNSHKSDKKSSEKAPVISQKRAKELLAQGCAHCGDSVAYKRRAECKLLKDTTGAIVGIVCPDCCVSNKIRDVMEEKRHTSKGRGRANKQTQLVIAK